jgi:hypothetical protein
MPGMEGLAGMMQDPAVASLMSNPEVTTEVHGVQY